MKAVVVEASPRREGSSVTLARSFIKGLREGGETEVTELFLRNMDMKPCIGCWKCLEMEEPGCVIEDDMAEVYPLLRAADLIVFATPIYWWHLAGQMKVFLDRLEGILAGGGLNNLSGKGLVLILTHLVEDPDGVDLVVRMFRSITGWAGMSLEVIRYCSEGGHVSGSGDKLEEAYQLGRSYVGLRSRELNVRCNVEGCKGMFESIDSLARHMTAAAGLAHRAWRREHGFEDRGMADDEQWKQIARKLEENL